MMTVTEITRVVFFDECVEILSAAAYLQTTLKPNFHRVGWNFRYVGQ